MKHRLVVIIWNGEGFDHWRQRTEDCERSGQDIVNDALAVYFENLGVVDMQKGYWLVHGAMVASSITRYVSRWVDQDVSLAMYREVVLNLPADAEPEVLIEFRIPESEEYDAE